MVKGACVRACARVCARVCMCGFCQVSRGLYNKLCSEDDHLPRVLDTPITEVCTAVHGRDNSSKGTYVFKLSSSFVILLRILDCIMC